MLNLSDYAYDLDSHFQDENIIPYASAPMKQLTVSESSSDGVQADGSKFLVGFFFALLISTLFWGLIFWAVKGIFF
jgi:hypothetical protein